MTDKHCRPLRRCLRKGDGTGRRYWYRTGLHEQSREEDPSFLVIRTEAPRIAHVVKDHLYRCRLGQEMETYIMEANEKNFKGDPSDKMTLPEIQDALYDMLVEFDKFCRENNIRYYLTGGTMLGAIRHHGFIPWDDDVDIDMPRPDYERFCELTKNGLGKYSVEVSSEVYVMFAKVLNKDILMESTYEGLFGKKQTLYIPIFIDICPMDGLPDNNLLFKLHASYIGFLTGLRGSLFHGFFWKFTL
ncbi:MAG: LicD family protein [Clostridiales bacterium]|nr:LicD family protein [Clostridiales bacterium]